MHMHIARKNKAQRKGTVNCSCSKNAICHLQKQCMTKDIVYKTTVTTSNPNTIMNYIGMTSTTFKLFLNRLFLFTTSDILIELFYNVNISGRIHPPLKQRTLLKS